VDGDRAEAFIVTKRRVLQMIREEVGHAVAMEAAPPA
jgi:hypothetical protein